MNEALPAVPRLGLVVFQDSALARTEELGAMECLYDRGRFKYQTISPSKDYIEYRKYVLYIYTYIHRSGTFTQMS